MAYRVRKAAQRVGLAVSIGEIGFYVIDGRAVHQIGPRNDQGDSRMGVPANFHQPDAGKADRIGTERGARSENAHALIPAQSGRANGSAPSFALDLRKPPDQP